MLGKPHSGVNLSAVGCEFTGNESTIDIKQGVFKRNTNKARLCVDQLEKTWRAEADGNLTRYSTWEPCCRAR